MRQERLTKEQFRILKTMDVDAALKRVGLFGFIPDDREIALAGMHKARLYAGRAFTAEERKISREWLTNNGFTRRLLP